MSTRPFVALGLDFGTESVRALLVDGSGAELGSAVARYRHGQIADTLPSSRDRLPPLYALQHPQDWLDSGAAAVRAAMRCAKLKSGGVVSIGVDFTSCTMLPTLGDGTPLCQLKEYAGEPLAWPKLWKHHAAKQQTDRMNEIARRRKEAFLGDYGGTIGLEWFFPKVLETLEHAPHVYAATEVWLEAGDWFVWQLVGGPAKELPRSTCQAGYKALWSREASYPSSAFLKAVHPGLANVVRDKMLGCLMTPGQTAGLLTPALAKRLGLSAGIPVSAAVIDAHAGVPGAGASEPGTLVMVLGTSSCHMINSMQRRHVPGVAGVVEGGILPGMFGYETGQAAVGDAFDWLRKCVGHRNFDSLNQLARAVQPAAEGVRCLDWLNGCRTPLMDGHLRGAFTGLTLQHEPAHLYRALMEGSAFGLRWIVELLRENGVPVKKFVATGGLPHHNPLLVEIYADVLGEPISVHPSKHGPALGAAILGALAASERTGFRSAAAAVRAMAAPSAACLSASHSSSAPTAATAQRMRAPIRSIEFWPILFNASGRTNQQIQESGPMAANGQVQLIASGDLRLSANQNCWAAQHEMEQRLSAAVAAAGYELVRVHPYMPEVRHGFIASQREGLEVFKRIDPAAPLVVAEAVWQYSHHVLPGLTTHRGPVLTVANWSGTWPGLVGMLNLNGSLTKADVAYSTLWSEDFTDDYFTAKLRDWLATGKCSHDLSHVVPFADSIVKPAAEELGRQLAQQLVREKAIMGVFDEGCMGMFNAIVPDHLLHRTGVFKERLSQSALYFETMQVGDDEAAEIRRWMEQRGMRFHTGPHHETDLTDRQILLQCKMYVAALRIADDFGCVLIGIQYQQGLKDLLPASDLVEGTLNNADRPPVRSRDGARILFQGQPLVHFNEVDECAGLDALLTYRVQRATGQPVETTLHDIRWGDWDRSGTVKEYVWVFLISGAAPPAHFTGGWAGAEGWRQPVMYFPSGGSTLRGISKPGEIVWSRIYIERDALHMDCGRGRAVELPREETERRWQATTPQWPIMHAVLYGVTRDALMAQHKSNHIQVVYSDNAAAADLTLQSKAVFASELGINVNLCG